MSKEPKERWKPNPKLTNKQNNFVHARLNNPKLSNSAVAKQVYGSEDMPIAEGTAWRIASDNMHHPMILAELYKYTNQAELNLIKLANATTDYALEGGRDGAAYASVAEKVNNSLLDRIHGKSTTKIEQQTTAVTINIDLTSAT